MTEAQVSQLLVQYSARYVTTRDGVQWWKLPDGSAIGKRALGNGLFELRRFPASACGC